MQWSAQQAKALDAVAAWMRAPDDKTFVLHGYAGTGKTELAKHFAAGLKDVFFCAYTGKAALVLRERGCPEPRTIHSLFYSPGGGSDEMELERLEAQLAERRLVPSEERNEYYHQIVGDLELAIIQLRDRLRQPSFGFNEDTAARSSQLVVIDEGSMIGEEMAHDILSVCSKVLFIGDPFQLPPVRGEGYFMGIPPRAVLTDVWRHAGPILRWATAVREGRELPFDSEELECNEKGLSIARRIAKADARMSIFKDADQVICGMNKTRRKINSSMRARLHDRTSRYPVAGDRVICLQNNRDRGLLNGLQGVATEAWQAYDNPAKLMAGVEMDGGARFIDLPTWADAFDAYHTADVPVRTGYEKRRAEAFDYAYAVTCHKAQGSQWGRVVVVDEGFGRDDDDVRRRWLYTAITRAKSDLTIVS